MKENNLQTFFFPSRSLITIIIRVLKLFMQKIYLYIIFLEIIFTTLLLLYNIFSPSLLLFFSDQFLYTRIFLLLFSIWYKVGYLRLHDQGRSVHLFQFFQLQVESKLS
jgi:hypothetical protein